MQLVDIFHRGSVLGPVPFNVYVSDFQDVINTKVCQYADDTTCYLTRKIKDLPAATRTLQNCVTEMNNWSLNNNFLLNVTKIKLMIFSTQQMSKIHQLDKLQPNIYVNQLPLEKEKYVQSSWSLF